MPPLVEVPELPRRVGTTEVIDPDGVDRLIFGRGHCAEWFAQRCLEAFLDTLVVIIYKTTEATEVLSPIIVRVSYILVAVFMSTTNDIEVREIARVGPDRDGDNRKGRTSEKDTKHPMGRRVFMLALQHIEDSLGNEDIEEGKNRKEVAVTDIEIAGDTDIAIEEDKEDHQVLCDAFSK